MTGLLILLFANIPGSARGWPLAQTCPAQTRYRGDR